MHSANERRITIKQVAEAAGVSAQTVSRVLNNRPDVAPLTRQRILEIIDELGYQPNIVARSLSQRRTYTLGVVTAGLKYTGPSRTLNGITNKAEELGYTLLLKELLGFDGHDVNSILNYLLARQVDGIIWAVQEVADNRQEFDTLLPEIPVPIVFLTMARRPGLNIVAVDNYAGGRQATEHLLELGHRKIGHIAGPLAWWEARERKRGWEERLAEAGLSAQYWAEGTWSSRSGVRTLGQLLAQAPDLTAVFAANDQMALGALHYAHRHGIRVPEDLSLVGFDNLTESAYFWPPLTTIDHDQFELGCLAVREAVKAIESQQDVTSSSPHSQIIFIQPKLVVRESSGPLAFSST
ncbi:MAG: LacI family transcriptional regulator [Chloroflexi bacterium]|nr:LacI family transcriptional regulator [Chloroflexota bacterium]